MEFFAFSPFEPRRKGFGTIGNFPPNTTVSILRTRKVVTNDSRSSCRTSFLDESSNSSNQPTNLPASTTPLFVTSGKYQTAYNLLDVSRIYYNIKQHNGFGSALKVILNRFECLYCRYVRNVNYSRCRVTDRVENESKPAKTRPDRFLSS